MIFRAHVHPLPPDIPLAAPACRLVLIEDDAMLRSAIATALQAKFAPRAIVEFGRGREGLDDCLRVPPALLIVDLRLPDLDGREVIRQLRAAQPAVRVVVLTAFTSERLPAELIALGVGGLVDKDSTLDHTLTAVQRVLGGGMYFTAGIAPIANRLDASASARGVEALAEQECAVVRLVTGGLSSKETAVRLGLSPRTVEKYRASAMDKLGLRNHTELVRWALQHGLG